MEEPVKPEECEIEVVLPKKKTLKQARLPFQMLSSSESPNFNKKRKLASPTLLECKSPKLVKMTTKQNSFDASKTKVAEIINLDDVEDEKKASELLKEKVVDETVDMESTNIQSTPKSKPKKPEEKSGVKSGSLTRFLTKTESKDSPKNKSESLKENAKPELSSNADVSMECEITKEHDEIGDSGSENQPEITKAPASETGESEEIEVSVEKSETEEKEEIDKDQDFQEADVSKYDSDTESSEDEQVTDNRTDVDESEEKKKNTDEIKTPRTKRNSDFKHKKMTPKQLERHMERQKQKEEREQLRLERERKREEERENRKRLKEEKKKEKDEKEKAEREQKKKEKEQKELKKQMEIEQRQREKEAKKKREEAKEEEKRRKEEEKLEAERKKQKAALNFVGFFVPKKPLESKTITKQKTAETKNFMPFEVKADMRIAPVCRRTISDDERRIFDEHCEKQSFDKLQLYLEEIRSKRVPTRKSGKTWPPETKEDDDDVVILENDNEGNYNFVDRGNVTMERHRAKLLMFGENRRPPFRGTWRKKSSFITSRKPFIKDKKWFDYEIDSDEDWEEEEPGESLHGSDDEKDLENPDDNEYDVDNEFMVPHGYLSEEEAHAEDDEDMNPETQKFKLKILGEQFEAERNTKTSKLKPKVIGCIWQNSDNTYASNIHSQVLQLLKEREVWVSGIPINLQTAADNDSLNGSECGTPSRRLSSIGPGARKTRVPEEAMPDLIRLVHGNINGRGFLVKEFMCFWTKKNELRVSKVSLSKKIREIARWTACPEEGPMHQKYCWFVNEEVRKKYLGDEDCGLPNRWTYTLTPKKRIEVAADLPDKTEKDDKEKEKEKEKKSVPLITQFTKKFTQEEMKKQLSEKSATKPTPPFNKKRVALISVGRGEKFPKSPRMSLLDKFIGGENTSQSKETATKETNDDDIMIIEDEDNKKEESKNTDEKKNLENRQEAKGENSEEKDVESEDDCIMILDDSQDGNVLQESEKTNLDKINDTNVTPSQFVIKSSKKSDEAETEDELKMEASTTE